MFLYAPFADTSSVAHHPRDRPNNNSSSEDVFAFSGDSNIPPPNPTLELTVIPSPEPSGVMAAIILCALAVGKRPRRER
jgi:hypothetical protein